MGESEQAGRGVNGAASTGQRAVHATPEQINYPSRIPLKSFIGHKTRTKP
jgi:hypothetical protein